MDISIVVPLFNEAESLPELFDWIKKVMLENKYSYEVIMVDDGSNDNSWEVIENLSSKNPEVKEINDKLSLNFDKVSSIEKANQLLEGLIQNVINVSSM